MKSTREILAALVAFDTTSRNSNLALIDFVEDWLQSFGVVCRRIYDETGTKANLWATIGESSKPGLVLSGHTDVVPVDGQRWSSDPFALTERDGRLYGRGACDMKGFLASVLAAVPRMLATELERPIHLAFSYDEEVGCLGAKRLVDQLAADGIRPSYCIVGEPTMMGVVIGHKAKRSMRVTVRGRSCHSSLAPEGVNAVEYASELIIQLRRIGERLSMHGPFDEAFDVPFTTAHTGTVQGGYALNIVPDLCVFQCEFRVLPHEDPDILVEEFRNAARAIEARMQRQAPEAGIAIDVYAAFPGLDTAPEAEITRMSKSFAATNGDSKVAYGTEAGHFATTLGTQTVICGPGSISVAHKADEFIEIAQLDSCDAFLMRLIEWNRTADHCK